MQGRQTRGRSLSLTLAHSATNIAMLVIVIVIVVVVVVVVVIGIVSAACSARRVCDQMLPRARMQVAMAMAVKHTIAIIMHTVMHVITIIGGPAAVRVSSCGQPGDQ